MKQTIRITESELKGLIRKCVNESLPPTWVQNMTGIDDDDELNASVEGERSEELEHSIGMDVYRILGDRIGKARVTREKMSEIERMLGSKYGMRFIGTADDDMLVYKYSDGTNTLEIVVDPFGGTWQNIFVS